MTTRHIDGRPAESPRADVVLDHVSKSFGAVLAVDDVSLSIPRGVLLSLLGPSGCGKTTTLRLIAGFEAPSRGDVFIRGRRVTAVPPYRRDFSMVFQSFALFPHMTVADNVGFGLRMRRLPRAERAARVTEALSLVQLSALADRYPRELSGGQQQRVALARAIVVRPAVLLLDEPLGSLDKKLRDEMQVELRQLQRRLGITAIFVTHDQEEALTLSDLVAVMHAGRIEQLGAPRDVYERPRTEFVAAFLGASNVLRGRVVARHDDVVTVDVAGTHVDVAAGAVGTGDTARIGVRPEKLTLAPRGSPGLPARVRTVVYRGSITHVYLETRDGVPLVAHVQNVSSATATWREGDEVACAWDATSVFPLA